MNYPSWWRGADFTAKAAWLVATHRARSYSEACSMLGRRKRVTKVSVTECQQKLLTMKLD